jgi:hypothetical protein
MLAAGAPVSSPTPLDRSGATAPTVAAGRDR